MPVAQSPVSTVTAKLAAILACGPVSGRHCHGIGCCNLCLWPSLCSALSRQSLLQSLPVAQSLVGTVMVLVAAIFACGPVSGPHCHAKSLLQSLPVPQARVGAVMLNGGAILASGPVPCRHWARKACCNLCLWPSPRSALSRQKLAAILACGPVSGRRCDAKWWCNPCQWPSPRSALSRQSWLQSLPVAQSLVGTVTVLVAAIFACGPVSARHCHAKSLLQSLPVAQSLVSTGLGKACCNPCLWPSLR